MEDFVEYLPSTHGGSRPDLYVRKTRLRSESGVPYNFWGLFCHRDIKRVSLSVCTPVSGYI